MFAGKTAVITGGANGIGKGIARMFAQNGANVGIADIDSKNGQFAVDEILENGGKAFFVETDVKKEEDIIRFIEMTIRKFGQIDVLINNAGISKFYSFFDVSVQEWDEVINTNLRSVFLCSREAARYMKSSGGAIINIASTRAFTSEPDTEAYSASKGGIIALTHSLAATLHPYRIRVNSISPGWIHTGDSNILTDRDHSQHWSGRVGTTEDIGRACLFLASPENDFITGQNLTVDGGMTRKMLYEE